MTIGLMGFFAPYIGCLLLARYGLGWPWPQAQIGGIALSTTSVAVVYAVMVETGYNRTELGKIILAACFINDIGTVLALGLVFANYNFYLLLFGVVTARGRRGAALYRAAGCSSSSANGRANLKSSFCSWCCSGSAGLPISEKARRCCRLIWSAWRWRRTLSAAAICNCACAPSALRF